MANALDAMPLHGMGGDGFGFSRFVLGAAQMTEQEKAHAMILALNELAMTERQQGKRGIAAIVEDLLALAPASSLARLHDALKTGNAA